MHSTVGLNRLGCNEGRRHHFSKIKLKLKLRALLLVSVYLNRYLFLKKFFSVIVVCIKFDGFSSFFVIFLILISCFSFPQVRVRCLQGILDSPVVVAPLFLGVVLLGDAVGGASLPLFVRVPSPVSEK